jgi:hypothetical protein
MGPIICFDREDNNCAASFESVCQTFIDTAVLRKKSTEITTLLIDFPFALYANKHIAATINRWTNSTKRLYVYMHCVYA